MNIKNDNINAPIELFYSSNHEWVSVDENIAIFGITEYAANRLGEVLYADLPEEGDRITEGNACAVIESLRSILDIVAPFSGLIVEVNSQINDNPSIINDSPYADGWLFAIELDHERGLSQLIRHNDYKNLVLKLQNEKNDV